MKFPDDSPTEQGETAQFGNTAVFGMNTSLRDLDEAELNLLISRELAEEWMVGEKMVATNSISPVQNPTS